MVYSGVNSDSSLGCLGNHTMGDHIRMWEIQVIDMLLVPSCECWLQLRDKDTLVCSTLLQKQPLRTIHPESAWQNWSELVLTEQSF